MSELPALNLNDTAMWIEEVRKRFVAQYVRVGAVLLVFVTTAWLVTVLSVHASGSSAYFALSALVASLAYVLVIGYFVLLIAVTYLRTGLLRCIVTGSAKFNPLFLPPFMIGAVILAIGFNLCGIAKSLVIILGIYGGAYGLSWVLGKLLSPRDGFEAAAYGEHWLALDHVTWHDLFLFRIPYERA